ncbi:hypothetical protein L798_08442 [Zootermopsis nevadensis]|uniref:Uncharacterized protein n=1 Tax=Zootermopsis nevadensis TaxID=136037 RepID=A0A067R3F2_ZOONE|nr:hypothetical protein L798_08442 [Zootermopsis nevadensis]
MSLKRWFTSMRGRARGHYERRQKGRTAKEEASKNGVKRKHKQ